MFYPTSGPPDFLSQRARFITLARVDAGLDFGADAVFGLQHVGGAVGHLDRPLAGQDHHAVVVGDDPVAGADPLAANADGLVDLAEALGLSGVAGDQAAPDGEFQPADLGGVADGRRRPPGPSTPLTRALSVASSPQMAGRLPPASMTMTSPGLAMSMASHRLGPVARHGPDGDGRARRRMHRVHRVVSPSRQGWRWLPMETLAVRTLARISRRFVVRARLKVFCGDGLPGVHGPADFGGGLPRVQGLGDRPRRRSPRRPAASRPGRRSRLLIPPATASVSVRQRRGPVLAAPAVLPLHLRIDRAMHVQPGDAQARPPRGRRPAGRGRPAGPRPPAAVMPPGLDALADGALAAVP